MLKIVSGGQTGVDRVALDVAIKLGIPHGGWCPAGRRAEDGVIPDQYELMETASRNYAVRTEQNIVDSDATLVFYRDEVSGGTSLTIALAKKQNKPLLAIDVGNSLFNIAEQIEHWITEHSIQVLNIAGPRLSSSPELPDRIRPVLNAVFKRLKTVS